MLEICKYSILCLLNLGLKEEDCVFLNIMNP